ncbi:MAG: hypothetical protein AMS25_03760 [Gemmatimonas sp. SM23_52]|nr:MAG: hypothetical protein AMS25_03760 [Gemmatimonas sp. SM23_52]
MPVGSLVLLLVAMAAGPRVTCAQDCGRLNGLYWIGSDRRVEPPAAQEVDSLRVSDGDMIAGGLLGGVLGGIAGGLIGLAAWSGCQGELCQLEGMAVGALVGEVVGLPIGVHLRDHRRGSFPLVLAGSVVTAAGAVAAAHFVVDNAAVPGVAVVMTFALLQVGVTVQIERRTRRPVR